MQSTFLKIVDAHKVSKIVYGTIIVLAVIVAMDDPAHPPSLKGAVGTVLLSAFAVALAEFYSDFIAFRIRKKRLLTRDEINHMARDVSSVMIGALLPLPFFILAGLGFITIIFAIILAKWTLVGVLLFYGYVASKLSGYGHLWSIGIALIIGMIGSVLVLIKASIGH